MGEFSPLVSRSWSEEVTTVLSERKLEIRTDGAKSTQITKNVNCMDESMRHEKMKGLTKINS